jgi:uncharacterized protein (DUF488 family)
MEVFTIGFTQSSAAHFFGRLKAVGIRQLLDVRLNNTSQLAGFAKRDDLIFFVRELCNAAYTHEPLLAPTQTLLDNYRKYGQTWAEYERQFWDLLVMRQVEARIDRTQFAVPTVLLCSEATAAQCHRRLALEYLQQHWSDLKITHL